MQNHEPAETVIFIGATKPEASVEQEMEARGLKLLWACSIKAAVDLLNSVLEQTVVATELALTDGNWRDVVERIRRLGRPVPIVLVTSARTAEMWLDALECGVEDILAAPLSASRLCQFLRIEK